MRNPTPEERRAQKEWAATAAALGVTPDELRELMREATSVTIPPLKNQGGNASGSRGILIRRRDEG